MAAEPVISYIVAAEFDQLAGSVIRHQYPSPMPMVDEHFLAEQMLPDGAHNRDEDWTWFFINRRPVAANPAMVSAPSSSSVGSISLKIDAAAATEQPRPTVYTQCVVYKDDNWEPAVPEPHKVTAKVEKTGEGAWRARCVLVPEAEGASSELLSFVFSENMQFTQLQADPIFIAVYSDENVAYGFKFAAEGQEAEFRALLQTALADVAAKAAPPPSPAPPRPGPMVTRPRAPPRAPPPVRRTPPRRHLRPRLRARCAATGLAAGEGARAGSEPGRAASAAPSESSTTSAATKAREAKPYAGDPAAGPLLYCMSVVKTKKDPTVRRGAIVKAVALCSSRQFVHMFRPLLVMALNQYFEGSNVEVLAGLYAALNALDLSGMPAYTPAQKAVYRYCQVEESRRRYPVTIGWSGGQKLSVPLTMEDEEVGGADWGPVSFLVQTFKEAVVPIYSCVLLEKRILFLGYTSSAENIARCVLGACRLVSPTVPGLLARAFPYANLAHLDFLSVPGYIAGVGNPMFEEKQMWWDLCCNIDTGAVTVNPSLALKLKEMGEEGRLGAAPFDAELASQAIHGAQLGRGEDQVAGLFREYTRHLLELEREEFLEEARRAAELKANAPRSAAFAKTPSARLYEARKKAGRESRAVTAVDVEGIIRALRLRRGLSEAEMGRLLGDLEAHVQTPEQVLELLSYLPETTGGILPVALGLFHGQEAVRASAVRLIQRVEASGVGVRCVDSLNIFLQFAYNRCANALPPRPA
eukprot:tig00000350_g24311.t1